MANVITSNLAKEEKLLRAAFYDKLTFGKLFLPDDFMRSETPFFHYEVMDAIEDPDIKQLAIILPRGHGKTALTKCDILHSLCFNSKAFEWGLIPKEVDPLFIGWIAASSKISVPNLDYIKTHLEYNEKILRYFGKQKGRKWTEDTIDLIDGSRVVSKSNLSGIRGGAKMHKRYDLIVLDDFEDENNTITAEARAKLSNLVTAVVFPALEPKIGRMRINGTPVHYDSFIQKRLIGAEQAKKRGEKYSWKVITYKAILPDGTVLWPDWFGMEELNRKKKVYEDSGTPQKFYQEYMMEVQSDKNAIFTERHLKYWDGDFSYDEATEQAYIRPEGEDIVPCSIYVGVDPATDSMRRESDFSVLIAIAVTAQNQIYVLHYERRRGLPVLGLMGDDKKGIVDYMFEFEKIYHPQLFTVEDTAMSKPIFQSLRAEMLRKNDFTVKYKAEAPGNRQSKRERIQGILAQRFAVGQVRVKKSMYDLIRELLTFGPRQSHDDVVDALAYACKYAHPPVKLEKDEKGKWRIKKRIKVKDWRLA